MMKSGLLSFFLVIVILPLPNQAIVPPKTPVLTGFDPIPVGSSGAARTLTCDASQPDAGTITYKWYRFSKDGTTNTENWEHKGYIGDVSSILIDIGSDKKADFTYTSTARIQDIREPASGRYRCRASNSAGTVDSEWEDLNAYKPCSNYTVSVSNTKPAIGSTFTLSCTRKTANFFSVYWWNKKDTSSPDKTVATASSVACSIESTFSRVSWIGCSPGSFTSAVDFKLQVTNAQTSDTGYWYCEHLGASCKSDPIKVVVQDKPGIPQITGFPSGQAVVGTTLNLKCVASPPGDTYEWYKDGTNVSTSITYDIDVKKTSAGKYKCIATNTKASTESPEKMLGVKWSATKLKMVESPSSTTPGSSVTIKCETDSSSTVSPGTILWYRNGQQITPGVTAGSRSVTDGSTIYTSVLTFTAKKEDNQAKYECKITDEAKFKKEVILTVRWPATKLKMTGNPTTPVITDATITIKCETDSSNSGSQETISWYRNGQEITTGITPSTGTSATNKGTIYKSVLTFTAKKEDNQAKYECRIKDQPSIKKEVTITVYYKADSVVVSSVASSSHVGQKAKFTCQVTGGNPPPTTTIFYKRSGSGTAPEVIQGERVMAKEDNQGEYYCKAKVANYIPTLDVTSTSKTYTVTFPNTKIAFDNLADTPVKVGEQKTFKCATDVSNPVTDIEWYQYIGGSWTDVTAEATPSKRDGGYGGKTRLSEWTVTATKGMNRATVRCQSKYTLTGHDYRTQADTMMHVEWSAKELKMVEKPISHVNLDSSVTIKCETDSTTDTGLTISWYRSDQQISSGVSGSTRSATDGGTIYESKLILTAKKEDNQAKYECKINNKASFKKEVTVNVHFPPNGIQLMETSITVNEGESKSITCSTTSSSNPAVSVSVKKRLGSTVDVPVTPKNTYGAYHGKDVSVVINLGTNRKDNGAQYICTFTYSSTSFEKMANVSVTFNPSKIILLQKPAKPVSEDQPIILICETDSANPAVDVLFHRKRTGKNWEPITTGLKFDDRNANEYNGRIRKGTLKVTANRLDNQAEFKCEVKGSPHLQQTARVDVYYPPTATLSLSPKLVKEGDTLTLTCVATGGNPTSYQYSWSYNEVGISQETTTVYKLANIKYTQSGRYQCRAINYSPGGFVKASIDIDILYKAKNDPKLSSVTSVASKRNELVSFTLHVIANPPVTDVIWFSSTNASTTNGFTTNKVSDAEYTFNKTSIEVDDYGNYTVNVTNSVGISTFEFHLKKAGKPHAPCCLKLVKVTLASVTLTFKSNFAGGTVQTFTVEKRQKGESNWDTAVKGIQDPGFEKDVETKIVKLKSSTNYEFRVHAVNEDGPSGYGKAISVETEDAPSVTLTAKRKGTLVTLTWTKLPRTYTKVQIKYCPKKGGSCQHHKVKDASQLQTSISVDTDQTYTFSMEIFEEDVPVFSSSEVEAEQPGPPVAIIGGAVGGVLFFLIILAVILAVVFVMKKRRADKDNEMLATSNGKPLASGQDNPGFNDLDAPDGFNPYESMELKTSPSTSVSIPMETSGSATYAQVNKPGKKPPAGDTYAEVDFSKKKRGKKGAAPDATYAEVKKKKKDKKKPAGDAYAEVDFSKTKKGKEKKGSSGPTDGPVYAEVNKKGKSPFQQPVGDEYAEVDFSKKAAKNSEGQGTNGDVYAEVKKPQKPQKSPKPGQGGSDTAVYANLPNGEEELYADVRDAPQGPSEYKQPKQAYQVGVDGTIYSEVRIQPPKKPNVIIGQDSIDDPYASVDFSKEAPPLPAAEDPDDPDDPGFIQLI